MASLENAPLGIRVNTVCPGAIDTPMIRGALETVGLTEAEFAPVLSLLGRFGRPEEVAQASLWLCSDQSSYVTGAVLTRRRRLHLALTMSTPGATPATAHARDHPRTPASHPRTPANIRARPP